MSFKMTAEDARELARAIMAKASPMPKEDESLDELLPDEELELPEEKPAESVLARVMKKHQMLAK